MNPTYMHVEQYDLRVKAGFKEAKYFINLMQVEMKIRVTPILSRIDNMGAGHMAEQSVTNKRTKHIDLNITS